MKPLHILATCILATSVVSLSGCIIGPDHRDDGRDHRGDDRHEEHHDHDCHDRDHDGDCDHHYH